MNRKKLNNELAYLWIYYKWPLLAALVILTAVLYSLLSLHNGKETVLSVMLIDCHTDISPEQMERDYLQACGRDPGRQQAEFLTTLMFGDTESGSYAMTSLSRFLADIGSGKLDVCGMREEDFLKYDNSGTWLDLRELTGGGLSHLPGDALVTADGRVIGLYTDALPLLQRYGCYGSGRGVIGVIYNAPHREAAAEYLAFAAGRQ